MSRFLLAGFTLVILSGATAHAQYAYMGGGVQVGAGSGQWGGGQGCTTYKVPDGVQEVDDEIDELKQMKKEAKEKVRDAKRDLKDIQREVSEMEGAISTVLKTEVASGTATFLREGMQAGVAANSGNVCLADGRVKPEAAGAGSPLPPQFIAGDAYCALSAQGTPSNNLSAFPSLSRPSESTPGTMEQTTCGDSTFTKPEYLTSVVESQPLKKKALMACKRGMIYLHDRSVKKKELEAIIAGAADEQREIDRQIKELRKDRRQAVKDAREDGEFETTSTEGGYCANCARQGLSTWDRVTNVAGSVLNAAATYYGAKHISNNNARLGWPTSPYAVTGLGLGSLMYGIYGAGYGGAGGGGGGGCGGGGGPGGYYAGGPGYGGGAFGYPGGWGPDGGGGAYNPGCGAWGCPGYPGGYPGGGYGGQFQGGQMVPMVGYNGITTGAIPGAIGVINGAGYPIQGTYPGGIQATYNVLPYPAQGGYPAQGVGYPGAYPGGGYPAGGSYPGGTYPGYSQILAQQAAQAAQYQQQYQSALSLDARLVQQVAAINQQRAYVWSSLGTANGGYYGGGTGVGGYPTGTILPYPSTGYDPNLGTTVYGTTVYGTTTTGTTTIGVTPARGRFN